MRCVAGGLPSWNDGIAALGEPTIQKERGGRYVGSRCGTSFACPHVTHAAAIYEKQLEAAISRPASANLIRAMIGAMTKSLPCGEAHLTDEDTALRLAGYGFHYIDQETWTTENSVKLLAMDSIEENRLQIYRLKIPRSFLTTRGKRGITVSLAYDPPVRASRKEYLSRTMWVEILKGLSDSEVAEYRARYTGEEEPPRLPAANLLDLRPPKSVLQWSTLQVRRKEWSRNLSLPVIAGDDEPVLHILIGCQKRFPTGEAPLQGYGLVVHLWHEGEHVRLYQQLRSRIRVPAVVRARQGV